MPRKPRPPAPPRRTLLVIGLVLLVILVAGNLIARQVAIFKADDLVVDLKRAYTFPDNRAESAAVFAETIDQPEGVAVNGHALYIGDAIIVAGGVQDDLTAMATTVDFSGTVDGNAVFMGETITLNGTVSGETVVFATQLIVEGGDYTGGIVVCSDMPVRGEMATIPCDIDAASKLIQRAGTPLASASLVNLLANGQLRVIFGALLPLPAMLMFTGFAVLLTTVFTAPMHNMEAAARTRPVPMLITGGLLALMLGGVTALWLLLLAYITPVGLIVGPLYLLLLLLVGAMGVVGWAALAGVLGGWLARRFSDKMQPPLVLTALGSLLLTLVALALRWVPGGGLVLLALGLMIGLVGVGVVYQTRLGTRAVVRV